MQRLFCEKIRSKFSFSFVPAIARLITNFEKKTDSTRAAAGHDTGFLVFQQNLCLKQCRHSQDSLTQPPTKSSRLVKNIIVHDRYCRRPPSTRILFSVLYEDLRHYDLRLRHYYIFSHVSRSRVSASESAWGLPPRAPRPPPSQPSAAHRGLAERRSQTDDAWRTYDDGRTDDDGGTCRTCPDGGADGARRWPDSNAVHGRTQHTDRRNGSAPPRVVDEREQEPREGPTKQRSSWSSPSGCRVPNDGSSSWNADVGEGRRKHNPPKHRHDADKLPLRGDGRHHRPRHGGAGGHHRTPFPRRVGGFILRPTSSHDVLVGPK